MLLALHDERIPRVGFESAEIEFDDEFPAGAIPDAELRLDQAAPDDVIHQSEIFEDLQRSGVRGRGARIVVDPLLGLEDLNIETLARQRQRGDDPDRAGAGNEDGTLGSHRRREDVGVGL